MIIKEGEILSHRWSKIKYAQKEGGHYLVRSAISRGRVIYVTTVQATTVAYMFVTPN